jgi:hypothetical protein
MRACDLHWILILLRRSSVHLERSQPTVPEVECGSSHTGDFDAGCLLADLNTRLGCEAAVRVCKRAAQERGARFVRWSCDRLPDALRGYNLESVELFAGLLVLKDRRTPPREWLYSFGSEEELIR